MLQTEPNCKKLNTSKWTYISRTGERNLITILHSPRLGHFLIFFNRKIVLADKKVFGQDAYSFFIDDELCVVEIKIINNQYVYAFRIDNKADTPLNQFRKKNDKKNLFYSIITFSFLFFMVATTMISYFHYEDSNKWASLQEYGILSVGTVHILELKENQFHIFYDYRDGKVTYRDELKIAKTANPVLNNGFPIYNNTAFLLTYSDKDKAVNKLHIDYPTPKTIQHYRALAKEKYQSQKREVGNSSEYCDCILDIAYRLQGWQGYALFYNEQTTTKANKRFNQKNYQAFVNSKPFLDQEIDCWQFK